MVCAGAKYKTPAGLPAQRPSFRPWRKPAWSRLVEEWLAAKGDPTRLQPFVNLTLGEAWRDAVETLNENELAGRVQGFSLKALPEGVAFITCGVDCQDDRLELVFMGHGRDNEIWILGNQVLWGRPQEEGSWQELDAVIRTVWTHPKGGSSTAPMLLRLTEATEMIGRTSWPSPRRACRGTR